MTDEQIKALAEKNGVVGIMTFPTMVDDKNPSVERVLDHIVNLVGVDHVGFGADFSDYIEWSPAETGKEYFKKRPMTKGLEDVTKLPNLVKGMINRGYPKQEVKKFLGEIFYECLRMYYRKQYFVFYT